MNSPVKVRTTAGGTSLEATTVVNAPIGTVWNVLKFPGDVAKFHPLIKHSHMIGAAENGLGARRHCDLLPMGEFDELITDWRELEGFTLEVVDGKMLPPHHFMKGRFELAAQGEQTVVTFTFSYQLKYGFLGSVLDLLFVRPQFRKAPPLFVAGLKAHVERQVAAAAFA